MRRTRYPTVCTGITGNVQPSRPGLPVAVEGHAGGLGRLKSHRLPFEHLLCSRRSFPPEALNGSAPIDCLRRVHPDQAEPNRLACQLNIGGITVHDVDDARTG
jgi:hypothetical protein